MIPNRTFILQSGCLLKKLAFSYNRYLYFSECKGLLITSVRLLHTILKLKKLLSIAATGILSLSPLHDTFKAETETEMSQPHYF